MLESALHHGWCVVYTVCSTWGPWTKCGRPHHFVCSTGANFAFIQWLFILKSLIVFVVVFLFFYFFFCKDKYSFLLFEHMDRMMWNVYPMLLLFIHVQLLDTHFIIWRNLRPKMSSQLTTWFRGGLKFWSILGQYQSWGPDWAKT